MFGSLRLVLALFVLFSHLGTLPHGTGTTAVFIFFTLSGFLMTLIMHESYGFTNTGRKHFLLNRFYRLYPMYWVIFSCTLIVLFITGTEFAEEFHGAMVTPSDLGEWFSNILMVYPTFQPGSYTPRLSPPTWALTVEIAFYVLICLGISKTLKSTVLWSLASTLYVPVAFICELDAYSAFPLASLPFSLGALTYYFYKKSYNAELLKKYSESKTSLLITAVLITILILLIYVMNFGAVNHIRGLYPLAFFGMIGFSPIIIYHFAILKHAFSTGILNLDKQFGDFSYPIYLSHYLCGLLLAYLYSDSSIRGGGGYSVQSALICVIFSWGLIYFIDKPIQKIRAKVRNAATKIG